MTILANMRPYSLSYAIVIKSIDRPKFNVRMLKMQVEILSQ